MNAMFWLVDDSLTTRLTLSLLHFLWQGCFAGVVVVIGGVILRSRSASLRYFLNVIVMLLMAACLPATFMLVDPARTASNPASNPILESSNEAKQVVSSEIVTQSLVQAPGDSRPFATNSSSTLDESIMAVPNKSVATQEAWLTLIYSQISSAFPLMSRWVAGFYLCGVIAILGRLLQGILGGHRLRKLATPITESNLLGSVRKLARQVGLKTAPTVAWCNQISVPVVVGVMKPMILLPMEVVSGLTAEQLEALLLHELSHIRRFDPIVNILQRVIEAILFFHPVVWFVSRRVSFERENAADDMVLAAGWDRPRYADALVRVAELATAVARSNASPRSTVLSVAGRNQSEFKLRVMRLLGSHPPKLDVSRSAIVLALLLVFASSMAAFSSNRFIELPGESAVLATSEGTQADQPALRISGRVLDAETGELIKNCRMVPTMSEGEDTTHVTWQSHYLKAFTDGRFIYATDRPWARTRLRIEADGYQPAITRHVKAGEDVELDMILERRVLAGIVQLPNGAPAAKAQVALASWTNEIKVVGGNLSYSGHAEKLRQIVETDEQGRFVLPAEIDPSVLVVSHADGYAERANAETSLARKMPWTKSNTVDAPVEEDVVIKLEPWGRVEGRVLIQDEPVEGARYWIYQGRTDDVHVWNHTNVETDADGRFAVENVPPGRFGTCQRYAKSRDGNSSYSLSGLSASFEVSPGKTVELELGGRGRKVMGKLVASGGIQAEIVWSKATLHVSLQHPHFRHGFGGTDESGFLWGEFLKTEEGKQYTQKSFAFDIDGSFRIEGLPAARYDLNVEVVSPDLPDGTVLSGSESITVPADVPIDANLPIDLGTVQMKLVVGTKLINALQQELSKSVQPQSAAKGFVKNGLRYELDAVAFASAELPSGVKRVSEDWWSPDGTKLDTAPSNLASLTVPKDRANNSRFREIVMRAQIVDNNAMHDLRPGEFWLPPTNGQWIHTSRSVGPDILKFQLMKKVESEEPISFALYFTEEPWTLPAVFDPNGNLQENPDFDAATLALYRQLEVSIVEKTAATTVVQIVPMSDETRRSHLALSAIKLDGQKVIAMEPTNGYGYTLNIPASEIDAFQISLRRMTHKATFENVAVKPGQSTNPTVSLAPLDTLVRVTFRKDGKTLGRLSDMNIAMLEEALKSMQHDLNSETGEIIIETAHPATFDEADRIVKQLKANGWKWPSINLPPPKKTINAEQQHSGPEFLSSYPKLSGLSLSMNESEFLAIAEQQQLKLRKSVDDEKVRYQIGLGDDHTLIVMFDAFKECSGIQRIRGELQDPGSEAGAPPGETESLNEEKLRTLDNAPMGECRGLLKRLDEAGDVKLALMARERLAKRWKWISEQPPALFIRKLPEKADDEESNRYRGEMISVQTELDGVWSNGKGNADNWNDWIVRKQNDYRVGRLQMLFEAAQGYRKVEDAKNAKRALQAGLSGHEIYDADLTTLVAKYWPVTEGSEKLLGPGPEAWTLVNFLDELSQAQQILGEYNQATNTQTRLTLAHFMLSWKHPSAGPTSNARKLWSLIRRQSPLPTQLFWFNVVNAEHPKHQFDLSSAGEKGNPLTYHHENLAAAAPLEFATLTITAKTSGRKGLLDCYRINKEGKHESIGLLQPSADSQTTATITKVIAVPAGTSLVQFMVAGEDFHVGEMMVEATFTTQPVLAKDLPAVVDNNQSDGLKEKELASFQGIWCFDVLQSNAWPKPIGTPTNSAGRKSEQRWVINGNQIEWTSQDGEPIAVMFTIDPTKTPKQIDFTFLSGPHKGMKSIGIYEPQKGNDNYRWLCMTDPGTDAPRPTDVSFSSEKQQSMIGIYLVNNPDTQPITESLKRFQGTWQMTLCDSTLEGFGASQEDTKKWQWTIRGDEIDWSRNGETWKMKLAVDLSKSPMEMDLTYMTGPHKGATCQGMFQWGGVDQSQLMIAIQDPESDAPRPAKFSMNSSISTGLMILEPNMADR